MPDEPNRNVEEQLTAWARKRREEAGAPFELHPVTRKLLQDEVARTFPKKSDEPAAASAGWWKMFWPRFALLGSIGVALVAVVGILLPGLAKSKSKAQQLASVRQQEKALSADSGRRDAPGQVVPGRRRAVEAPVDHFGDEAVKTPAPESQPAAVPFLAENKPLEKEVILQAEPKDARLKAEQPAKVEERPFSEKSRQLVLSDKAKEAAPAGTAASARELNAEKERDQVLLRQRYALGPAEASGVTSATNALAGEQKIPATSRTPPAPAPQVAWDGATVGQRVGIVGGRGFAGGTATNPAPRANPVLNSPQNRAKADDRSLALTRQVRPATGGIVSVAERRETGRLGTGIVNGYSAAVPPTSSPQRFAQVREHRVNFNSPPMPNVLSSFQLEQNGRLIRVVDADGSIYDGAIEQPPTEEAARGGVAVQTAATDLKKNIEPEAKRVEGLAAASAGEIAALQNVFFRVAGTNRTLNQLVVFEGNFLAKKDQANELVVGAKLKANPSPAAARQSLSQKGQQVPGALIQGQATIGTSNRIEINAAPVSE